MHDIIAADKVEIFEFGMERILSIIFSCSTLFVTGVIFQGIIESVLFYLCFYYSRKYAGGYHASTYTRCNTCYLLTFIGTLCISRILMNSAYIALVCIGISVFVILTTIFLAPINNPSNPILEGKENKFFIFALLMNIMLICTAFLIQLINKGLSVFVFITLFISAVYMHIEIIRRREWGMAKILKQFGEKVAKLAMKNAKGSVREVSFGGVYQAKRPAILDKDSKK